MSIDHRLAKELTGIQTKGPQMTNQRRRELIDLYSDVVERGAEYGHRSSIIDLDDLEEILALLREKPAPTSQRRRELIAWLEGWHVQPGEGELYDDLLALLREEGLEWKVWLNSSPTDHVYNPPLLVATCNAESSSRHMAGFWGKHYSTITGPDAPPKSHATGIPENVVI